MIGLYNKDSSFFRIESINNNAFKGSRITATEDVISLRITEELYKMTTGTLSLNDPSHMYSKILINGVKLKIEFGYDKEDLSPESLQQLAKNPNEYKGALTRRGIIATVRDPSGTLGQNGQIQYNCNLIVYPAIDFQVSKTRSFVNKTYFEVINTLMDELKIKEKYIDFNRKSEKISPYFPLRQDNEGNYRFISTLSLRLRSYFRVGLNALGKPIGLFVDYTKIDGTMAKQFSAKCVNAVGTSNLFEYQDGARNIISATWTNKLIMSGQGAGARIVYVGGKPQVIKYVMENDKVVVWKINMKKIRKTFAKKGDFVNNTKLIVEWASKTSFDQVKEFFYKSSESTYRPPGGLGYEVNINAIGNTMVTAPNLVAFGTGFPPRLQQIKASKTRFYIKKVDHVINREGYKNQISIADSVVLFSTFKGSFM